MVVLHLLRVKCFCLHFLTFSSKNPGANEYLMKLLLILFDLGSKLHFSFGNYMVVGQHSLIKWLLGFKH